MNKRGQVTIFIIIAILIIGAVSLFFTLKGSLQKESIISPEEAPIVNFVEQCLKKTIIEGVSYIALSGGYYKVPEPKEKFFSYDVPFYWYNGKNLMPSKEIVEMEFSKYIEENLPNCLQGFNIFEEQGYVVQEKIISAKVSLFQDKITVDLNFPIYIQKGEFTGRVENFQKEINTNFYESYLIIKEIIAEQEGIPNSIPLGFISSIAYENDFTFKTINLNDSVIYFFVFNQEEEDEFIYSFSSKYKWEDLA